MATIGIDLTPLQTAHRMRGVGATVANIIRSIPDLYLSNQFVFYVYNTPDVESVFAEVNLSRYPNSEIRYILNKPQRQAPTIKSMRGLLYAPIRVGNFLREYLHGTKYFSESSDLDMLIQFEQDVIPQKKRDFDLIVIAYDLIPLILEEDYLSSYRVARKHGRSIKGSIKMFTKRQLYRFRIRTVLHRANHVIAISENTKRDFVSLFNIPESKISVAYLGIPHQKIGRTVSKPRNVLRFIDTHWGDIAVNSELPDTPFMLYIGGVDPRRRITDIIKSYNLLRARGYDMHLVLAGDTMLGPNSVPNQELQEAILASSYKSDIFMLGFVSESTKEYLYQDSVAFVYPSLYEGFGLPVLEAMNKGTPVITFDNSSIKEVAGSAPIYTNGYKGIFTSTEKLLLKPEQARIRAAKGMEFASSFTWSKASENVINIVMEHIGE